METGSTGRTQPARGRPVEKGRGGVSKPKRLFAFFFGKKVSQPKDGSTQIKEFAKSSSSSEVAKPLTARKTKEIPSEGQKAAKNLLSSLIGKKPSFKDFNKNWEILLKGKNSAECEEIIKGQISKMSSAARAGLCRANFCGCNKKGALFVLKHLKKAIQSDKDLTDLQRSRAIMIINKKLEDFRLVRHMGTLEPLGNGKVNVVEKVTYAEKSGEVRVGVFKAEPSQLGKKIYYREKFFGTAAKSGVPVGADGFSPERSVASARVDRLIFGNEGICVGTDFAEIGGREGILMEMASGSSPKVELLEKRALQVSSEQSADPSKQKEQTIVTLYAQLKSQNKGKDLEGVKLEEFLTKSCQTLGARKLELRDGVLVRTDVEIGSLSPKNPKTAEDLLKLQVFDWIIGQTDRHPKNYHIDESGRVKAIDNDCTFGVMAVPKGVDVRKQKGVLPNNLSLMLNMPPVLTKAIADQVIKINEDELRSTIENLMSPAEVEAAVERMRMLQEHVKNLGKCKIVETAEDLLKPENMALLTSNNSYLMRELRVYDQNKKGWNYLRVHREI